MSAFADKAIAFFQSLRFPARLPKSIAVMNPYQDEAIFQIVKTFFQRFYADENPRVFLWGVNPGRFGGGVTGIPFTDPFALSHVLGIEHRLSGKRELSSEFIYQVVEKWGGAKRFYSQFYVNSLSPLGFTRLGKNYNFYDDPRLLKLAEPFVVKSVWAQIDFGARRDAAVCLGTGKLYDVFSRLNDEHRFFERIVPLEHPRFIMQYRRKRVAEFVEKYAETLSRLTTSSSIRS
ncbi:MAG: DUF4918 family protein [Chloroherpetonaceae bacterium]|nr:DUF4918 family protein [Chloroherpetonaceae bacterium]MDW8437629.1 DUF4918 family protein [Chloroherpetonaceae bacterium]